MLWSVPGDGPVVEDLFNSVSKNCEAIEAMEPILCLLPLLSVIVEYSKTCLKRPLKNIFVHFVALCPKTTAMVMAGRSVHLTTLFPRQA